MTGPVAEEMPSPLTDDQRRSLSAFVSMSSKVVIGDLAGRPAIFERDGEAVQFITNYSERHVRHLLEQWHEFFVEAAKKARER